jgi:hypothetical protein
VPKDPLVDPLGLQDAKSQLKSMPAHFDMPLPAFVSHVEDYADNIVRLKNYLSSVIPVRIMQLTMTSFMKTLYFVDLYLTGIESENAYALPLAARAQMELFAVCWDVAQVVERNAGASDERLVHRAKEVDDALINATFGSRDSRFLQLLRNDKKGHGSVLRGIVDGDFKVLSASNVLTRFGRMAKVEKYAGCREDYERLCEVLHPNMAQSLVLMRAHPDRKGDVRFARDSVALRKLIEMTARPMAVATDGILVSVGSMEFPFGGQGWTEEPKGPEK